MVRRLHGESVMLAGLGRALLMQLAHPAVAAAVEAHSSFPDRRYQRLLSSLRLMIALVFGDEAQVAAAARSVNAMHGRVRGAAYDALDPELLSWVLATIIDTGLLTYERFVRPLTDEERQAYYEDMKHVGRLLAIPDGYLPLRHEELLEYTTRLAGELEVSPAGLKLAQQGMSAPLLLQPVWLMSSFVTAGLLPPPLRAQFALGWGPRRETALRLVAGLSRLLIPRLPCRLRALPWFLMPDAWLRPDEGAQSPPARS
jgi:uncharacterized protein (DUF2236 family)